MAEIDPYIISTYLQQGNQASNADQQTLADVAMKRIQANTAQFQLGRQQRLADVVSQNASAFSSPLAQALAQGGFGQEAFEAQANAIAIGQKILGIHRELTASRLSAAQTPEQLDAVITTIPQDVRVLYGVPEQDATSDEKETWRKSFLTGQMTPLEQAQLDKDRYEVKDVAGTPFVLDKRTGQFVGDADASTVGLLSDAAIDAVAHQLHQTGKMPSLGTDPGGRNERIIRARHAVLYPNDNLAANAAMNEADAESLKRFQSQADAVSGFIRTFDKNLDLLEEIAAKLQSADRPVLNKGLRWFQTHASGDPALTAFRQALSTVTSEAGKINSGSTGAGGVPLSVMDEMERNLPADATPAQIVAALKVLRRDSENRHEAMKEQLGAIKSRLGIQRKPAEKSTKSGVPALRKGEVLMIDTKGRRHAVSDADVKEAESHGWKRQ